jgi:T5orf172 domain
VLTESEILFLGRHGLTPDDVFDGRYLSRDDARWRAKELGKTLVLGSPCRAKGHRLRTRPGHCAQCDPKKIAYQQRFSAPAFVYIAGSLTGRVVKIGSCIDVPQREHQMQAESYGGYCDWKVLFHTVSIPEAGRIEHNARSSLHSYRINGPYYKDGSRQIADELLKCSFGEALRALSDEFFDLEQVEAFRSSYCWQYEFE